ncbi:MAG TPA: CHRD domain-containing protein [Anaerolineae bacterium]|nr:CHRD domain-containing protein [Anaerolineae bacterium]
MSTNALAFAGVTDLAIDPVNPNTIYASMLGRGISKTVDGGVTWTTAMNGLPVTPYYNAAPTRMSLGISRPSAAVSATLYAGFEYYDSTGTYQPSVIFKSTDDANNWTQTADVGDVVNGYCGTSPNSTQCYYDNVIGVDPITPTIVYALGLYNYGTGSGGVFRSMDGGTNWVDLGFNLHPDYHAIAIRKDDPATVVIGNDGGAWWSDSRGGRLGAGDPITATTWNNLNGVVDPDTAAVISRSGLALGQFTSVAANPVVANRFYGGLQDNGTQRKSTANSTWFDTASGDGGQVLVDPTDANYVYGTYYYFQGGPYRFTDGMGNFFSNQAIQGGIHTSDRSEFYIPMFMDPANPNRLYLGTFRVYRTDNAKAPAASSVHWNPISGDLTSGCTGAAANGGRGCVITAFGKSAGSPAMYVGTMEGWIWVTPDSTVSAPTWTRVDITTTMPNRPIGAFAVDRSNYRVAYVAYNGFDPATPAQPGHVFKTNDGGHTWANITNNLPDVPVNSIDVDPSNPNTLYAGTDIGPFVSFDDGASWSIQGSGFPIVAVVQMAVNAFTRQIVAATHGRGVWAITDAATSLPALQISKTSPALPVGPGSTLLYTLTVENHGNITATNVVITDPVPANTSFMAAGAGGSLNGTNVVFNLPDVPPASAVATGGSLGVGLLPGSVSVTFTVQITSTNVVTAGSVITNDGFFVTSAEIAPVYGSPYYVTLAPAHAVNLVPASQGDQGRPGQVFTYTLTVNNASFNSDTYDLAVSGNNWPTTFWNSTFTTPITRTPLVAAASSIQVGVQVTIPMGVANSAQDTPMLIATSEAAPSAMGSATVKTTAVTAKILLVDDDDNNPDVQDYYRAALDATGIPYDYWDIQNDGVLTLNNIMAHDAIVWFTGGSYPAPLAAYESKLATFLNGGGKLFMSGQDILDSPGGYTAFALNYLHVAVWNNNTQNDTGTTLASGVITSPLTSGLGDMPVDVDAVGMPDYSDWLVLDSIAQPALRDDAGRPNALTADTGTYKVIFLSFPFEAISDSCDRADVMARSIQWLMGGAIGPVCGAVVGPTSGMPNASHTFTATVRPAISAVLPLTYKWQATDFGAFSYTDGTQTTASYTWSTFGSKMIDVMAMNGAEVGARASLTGAEETPPVTTTAGSGVAIFTYDQATHTLHYEMATYGLTNVTASHIHRGAPGIPGPVAYPLTTPITGTSVGNVVLSAADEALLFSGDLYVNVHTTAHPGGEIRGQIYVTGGGRLMLSHAITIEYPNKIYLPLVLR